MTDEVEFDTDAPSKLLSKAISADREVEQLFQDIVWDRCKNQCGNCGNNDASYLKLVLIVPPSAGGQRTPDNATLLCRACAMAAASAARVPDQSAKSVNSRPVNFWVSQKLGKRIKKGIATHKGFNSMGRLCRFLMRQYVEDPDRYKDLSMYQDEGDTGMKINIWANPDDYTDFQKLCAHRNSTVRETLIALLMIYGAEAEPLLEGKEP